jgi:hypothetical protein
VVYDKYTTAKSCSYARLNAEYLNAALNRGILVIYHEPLRGLIAIINWFTNVINAVKINVCSYPWYIWSEIPRILAFRA